MQGVLPASLLDDALNGAAQNRHHNSDSSEQTQAEGHQTRALTPQSLKLGLSPWESCFLYGSIQPTATSLFLFTSSTGGPTDNTLLLSPLLPSQQPCPLCSRCDTLPHRVSRYRLSSGSQVCHGHPTAVEIASPHDSCEPCRIPSLSGIPWACSSRLW